MAEELSDIADPAAKSKTIGALALIGVGLVIAVGIYSIGGEEEEGIVEEEPSASYRVSDKYLKPLLPVATKPQLPEIVEEQQAALDVEDAEPEPEAVVDQEAMTETLESPMPVQQEEPWVSTTQRGWVSKDEAAQVRELEKELGGDTVIFSSSADKSDDRITREELERSSEEALRATLAGQGVQPASPNSLHAALTGTIPGTVSATWNGPRDTIMGMGTTLACVLETPINSSLPGMTRCTIRENVYSDTGANLVIPYGSQVVGEYASRMQRGVSRVFVIWSRLITPEGVVVALNSPGAGPMGESGIEAEMNHHFFLRFGSSILLSVVGGLAAVESENGTGPEAATANAFSDIASIALQDSIGIPSTGHVAAGALITILAAKDIDFKESIALRKAAQ